MQYFCCYFFPSQTVNTLPATLKFALDDLRLAETKRLVMLLGKWRTHVIYHDRKQSDVLKRTSRSTELIIQPGTFLLTMCIAAVTVLEMQVIGRSIYLR